MKKTWLKFIVMIAAAGSLGAGGTVATASAAPTPDAPHARAASTPRIQAIVCEMRGASTPYYDRNNNEYFAGPGQRFNLIYSYPNGWRNGDLWGGMSDVHIWGAYMFRVDEPWRNC